VGEGPIRITITLDKHHDYLPIDISEVDLMNSRIHNTYHYQVQAIESISGVYVPKVVVYKRLTHDKYEATWILNDASAGTGSIHLSIPKSVSLEDYRLLGGGITQTNIANAMRLQDHRLVLYNWSDHLPSESELWAMVRAHHPEFQQRDNTVRLLVIFGVGLIIFGLVAYRMVRKSMTI
jgi:hypothetical protein